MKQMGFESVGIIRPGCPARPAASRFRRAFAYGGNVSLPIGQESLTKSKKNFPLEPRAKTPVQAIQPDNQSASR